MSDITNHPTSIYFRLDLTGPSSKEVRNENKGSKKYKSSHKNYAKDNGSVAFGQAFKRFMK